MHGSTSLGLFRVQRLQVTFSQIKYKLPCENNITNHTTLTHLTSVTQTMSSNGMSSILWFNKASKDNNHIKNYSNSAPYGMVGY